jgi:hypothetical protein
MTTLAEPPSLDEEIIARDTVRCVAGSGGRG